MACDEHTRADLLRRAVAGRGLPAIEPGMPVPAGTGMTRRRLLLAGAGLGLTVFGGRALAPGAVTEAVLGATPPASPVLVTVFLSGGVDTLSLLPPLRDPRYTATLRPSLRVDPATALRMKGTDAIGWHPAAAPLKDLHDRGRLVVAPALGYASPNGSHFTSRHFYEVGATDPDGRTGWLGRLIDLVGEDHNPVQGLTMGPTLSPVLATATKGVAAVDSPTGYDFETPGVFHGDFRAELRRGLDDLSRLESADPVLGPVRSVYRDASDLRASLARPLTSSAVEYPDGPLGTRLRDLARLLGAGLPIRCAAVDSQLDFDTHAGQAGAFAGHVDTTARALAAFQRDLEGRTGLAGRVLTLVWSEFGRRPEENGSAGTDHGAAGLALLMGTRVRGTAVSGGGFAGGYPGLTTLDAEGNLRSTADFRGLYCSLLEQWFDRDAAEIIPGATGLRRYQLVV